MQTNLFAFRIFAVMNNIYDKIELYKGISPGRIIAHEMRKRDIGQRALASHIGVHNQTLNAIINGHRKLPVGVALKIERFFGWHEGFLLILQTYHNIAEFHKQDNKKTEKAVPDLRKILFWDTDFDKIDWFASKESVLRRVKERGNYIEKENISRFYNLSEQEIKQLFN